MLPCSCAAPDLALELSRSGSAGRDIVIPETGVHCTSSPLPMVSLLHHEMDVFRRLQEIAGRAVVSRERAGQSQGQRAR